MTLPFNFFQHQKHFVLGVSQLSLEVKNLPANAGDLRDVGLIPEMGRSLGGGHGNPFQRSRLENPLDRGAWWAVVHRVGCDLVSTHTHVLPYAMGL